MTSAPLFAVKLDAVTVLIESLAKGSKKDLSASAEPGVIVEAVGEMSAGTRRNPKAEIHKTANPIARTDIRFTSAPRTMRLSYLIINFVFTGCSEGLGSE